MTEFDEIYGSKYLSVNDLNGGVIRAKIAQVDVKELREQDGTMRKKYILTLHNQQKQLILNKTNAKTIAMAVGPDRHLWLNLGIELSSVMTGLGKPGLSVRVIRAQKPAPPPPPIEDDMRDEIPDFDD